MNTCVMDMSYYLFINIKKGERPGVKLTNPLNFSRVDYFFQLEAVFPIDTVCLISIIRSRHCPCNCGHSFTDYTSLKENESRRRENMCITYMHAYERTYVGTYTRTHARTYVRTRVHAYLHNILLKISNI